MADESLRGPCPECLYDAWSPVANEEECDLIEPHDGEHVRCAYCRLPDRAAPWVVRARTRWYAADEERNRLLKRIKVLEAALRDVLHPHNCSCGPCTGCGIAYQAARKALEGRDE